MGLNPTRGVLFLQKIFVLILKVHKVGLSVAYQVSLWPNWIRRLTTNQKIGGSSPSRDMFYFYTEKMFGIRNITARRRILLAWMPEGSKGADLRSAGHLSAWVRTPLQA